MNITLVSGTNRSDSATRKITLHIAGFYREHGLQPKLLDLADLPLEIFSPAAYDAKPDSFKRFSDAVLASDGLHVIMPEYNGGAPGVLKYFVDMLPFPEGFQRRPVCFTGLASGAWGALRSVEQMQAVFGYGHAYIFPERVFLPDVGAHLGSDGRIANEDWIRGLKKQVAGFLGFARQLRRDDRGSRDAA